MPLLLTFGVIVPSCAALTPGRVNASVATPARGSCDTFTPDPVGDELAVDADDPPPEHAVEEEDGVGTYATGGGAVLVDEVDGVPSGVKRIELGGGTGGTGCGNGRSWSGVRTPGGRVAGGVEAGVVVPGCCAPSCAATAVAVHEIRTAQMNRVVFFMTDLRSV